MNSLIILFIIMYEKHFYLHELLISGTACKLPKSVVDACTVNAFRARLFRFWQHQAVKFDFTADLTGTGNLPEEVIK